MLDIGGYNLIVCTICYQQSDILQGVNTSVPAAL